MTTIAWDGKALAGDKRVTYGALPCETTKIHRIEAPDGPLLVGGSGDGATMMEMIEWARGGRDPAKHPEMMKKSDNCFLVVDREGLRLYEKGSSGRQIVGRFAVGSGRDFAIMAMHLGHSAKEAVELATIYDIYTGNGVDVVSL